MYFHIKQLVITVISNSLAISEKDEKPLSISLDEEQQDEEDRILLFFSSKLLDLSQFFSKLLLSSSSSISSSNLELCKSSFNSFLSLSSQFILSPKVINKNKKIRCRTIYLLIYIDEYHYLNPLGLFSLNLPNLQSRPFFLFFLNYLMYLLFLFFTLKSYKVEPLAQSLFLNETHTY